METFNKWHESRKIEEGGILYFLKRYESNSYEIQNEIKWLTSDMIKACRSFKVPSIHESDIGQGFIKMEFIDEISNISKEHILKNLVDSSVELHNIYKSSEPITRIPTTKKDYKEYLQKFVDYRLNIVKKEYPDIEVLEGYIAKLIQELNIRYFTIVHRDFRLRHMLFNKENVNYLIDWEFSNISDYGQDLAKLVYDCIVNHKMKEADVEKYIVSRYSDGTNLSKDEILNKINTFLPIIPLEHAASFIKRTPPGYEAEVAKDVAFILSLYERNQRTI